MILMTLRRLVFLNEIEVRAVRWVKLSRVLDCRKAVI